ncbi:MAG: hypothetical protein Q8L78_00265 [Coxiellaceae bacterium]|nr:hypothetical protein [Coxiellaceae bacterium]
MRIIHQLYIEKALSQFLRISAELTYIEPIYDLSAQDEKIALLSYVGSGGHTLLMAAIANQHPFFDKWVNEMTHFLEDEKIAQLLKTNEHGVNALSLAVLNESVEVVKKIIALIDALQLEKRKEILSSLMDVQIWKQLLFFSNETGRVIFSGVEAYEKNKDITGALSDVVVRTGNAEIIEVLWQAGLRAGLVLSKLSEARNQLTLKKLQEEETQRRNEVVAQETIAFREISAANHRFFTTPIQGLVVEGPVISSVVDGHYVAGYVPTEDQVRVLRLRQ